MLVLENTGRAVVTIPIAPPSGFSTSRSAPETIAGTSCLPNSQVAVTKKGSWSLFFPLIDHAKRKDGFVCPVFCIAVPCIVDNKSSLFDSFINGITHGRCFFLP